MKKITASFLVLSLFLLFVPVPTYAAAPTDYVSCWDLDETSGTRFDANNTNNNDLTDTNTVLFGTGKVNNGADFEATNSEYLTIADNAPLSITGDLSYATWFNFESLPTAGQNRTFSGKWQESNNNSWIFSMWNNAGTYQWRINLQNSVNTSSQKFLNTSSLSTATWYHIVYVYTASAGTVQVYLNGASEGTTTGHVTNIKDSTASFELGANINGLGGAYADGIMDISEIYNRALTSTEIAALYNSGNGTACTGRSAVSPFAITSDFVSFE